MRNKYDYDLYVPLHGMSKEKPQLLPLQLYYLTDLKVLGYTDLFGNSIELPVVQFNRETKFNDKELYVDIKTGDLYRYNSEIKKCELITIAYNNGNNRVLNLQGLVIE